MTLAFALASSPAPAFADDHRPPRAEILTDRDSAPAPMYSSSWATREGPSCRFTYTDDLREFGEPVQWLPVDELALRFRTRHRPYDLEVDGYLVGDPLAGVPIYGHVAVPYRLRSVRVGRTLVWEAVLDAPPGADLYVDVTAWWQDVSGCGLQAASWTFRAGVLPF